VGAATQKILKKPAVEKQYVFDFEDSFDAFLKVELST